jgi:arsenic resistance protein ArsH
VHIKRIVDMMEAVVRFPVLLQPHPAQLDDRYSEHKDAGVVIDPASGLSSIATAPQAARS